MLWNKTAILERAYYHRIGQRLNYYRVNFFMNFEVTHFQFIIIDTDTVHRVPIGAHPNVYYISQLTIENEKLRVQFG